MKHQLRCAEEIIEVHAKFDWLLLKIQTDVEKCLVRQVLESANRTRDQLDALQGNPDAVAHAAIYGGIPPLAVAGSFTCAAGVAFGDCSTGAASINRHERALREGSGLFIRTKSALISLFNLLNVSFGGGYLADSVRSALNQLLSFSIAVTRTAMHHDPS